MRTVDRRLSTWLLLLGLALLVAVVVRVDAKEVLALVSQAGGWLLVAIVAHMGSLACAAWAWRALVAYKVTPLGWRKSVAIYWVGDAFNALTPGDALAQIGASDDRLPELEDVVLGAMRAGSKHGLAVSL